MVENLLAIEAMSVGEIARARVGVYRFLVAALDSPTPQQHAWMIGPEFPLLLEGLCASFGVECPEGELTPEGFADHESRYLACFEVGLPGPPVALLASHYNRREPIPRIIHEHILLYRHFGVHLGDGSLQPADHVVNQLAFLIHLDELSLAQTLESASVLRARHDFLTRHVARWAPLARDAAEEKGLPPVYCVLLVLLAAAVNQDQELTTLTLDTFSGETA